MGRSLIGVAAPAKTVKTAYPAVVELQVVVAHEILEKRVALVIITNTTKMKTSIQKKVVIIAHATIKLLEVQKLVPHFA